MADKRISELTNITGANLADADEFVVVDTSASETKAITYGELKKFNGTVTADGLTVDGNTTNQSYSKTYFTNGVGTNKWHIWNENVSGADKFQLVDGAGQLVFQAEQTGDISFYEDTGTTPKFFWDASAESLGIGTSSPSGLTRLTINGAGTLGNPSGGIVLQQDGTDVFYIFNVAADNNTDIDLWNPRNGFVRIGTNNTERMRIDSSGNVGIGTSVPATRLNIDQGADSNGITLAYSGRGASRVEWELSGVNNEGMAFIHNNGTNRHVMSVMSRDVLNFRTNNTERMRIDASGSLLVGKTSADNGATVGAEISANNTAYFTRSGGAGVVLNRTTSDGNIAVFQKDGTTVGSIGSITDGIYIGNGQEGIRFDQSLNAIIPCTDTGAGYDNHVTLGASNPRFKDIYATNAIIQTSDRNEKQDIAEMDEAERRVAVAAKGLLRKFRWKDAVAEKGDDARIHFGIIAQDLQAAFAAEGLDAGKYAMFIHTTWTDEETGEERSRMGVRYSELLAFIIAAI